MLRTMLLSGAERAVKVMLSRQTPAQQETRRALENKTVHVRLTDFNQDFYLLFTADDVLLQSTCAKAPDLTVSGDVGAFMQMASKRDAHPPQHIKLTGSARLAQTLQRFFATAHPDWRASLAELVGDGIAETVGDAAVRTGDATRRVLERLRLDAGEFLREERAYFPSQTQVERYCRSIDALRHRLSRLEARVTRLDRHQEATSCKSSD